jgi:hypothetical protein
MGFRTAPLLGGKDVISSVFAEFRDGSTGFTFSGEAPLALAAFNANVPEEFCRTDASIPAETVAEDLGTFSSCINTGWGKTVSPAGRFPVPLGPPLPFFKN